MTGVAEIQFGVNLRGFGSAAEFRNLVLRADRLGYDVIAAPDHLGGLAPFAALTAAAQLVPRLRLRTYVLNVGFWNPALLAREVATLDLLSGGRAELGLGAGHMKSEHDDAGLPWPPLAERVRAMEHALVEVRRRLEEGHEPAPVQHPVPVMIGAMSRAGLQVAARHAEVIGFAGAKQVRGAAPGTLMLSTSGEMAERVAQVREWAGGRPYRSDLLLQGVAFGDPEQSAAAIAAAYPPLTAELLLDSPAVLLAEDANRAAAELRRRHDVYGIDSVTTHQPYLEQLGEVMAAYRAVAAPGRG